MKLPQSVNTDSIDNWQHMTTGVAVLLNFVVVLALQAIFLFCQVHPHETHQTGYFRLLVLEKYMVWILSFQVLTNDYFSLYLGFSKVEKIKDADFQFWGIIPFFVTKRNL